MFSLLFDMGWDYANLFCRMNYLFTHAPLFVPTTNMKEFDTHDLQRRVEEAERKQGVIHVETHAEKNTIDHQI